MASRKQGQERALAREVGAIALGTLGALLFVGLLWVDRDIGPVLRFLAVALRVAFGMGAWAVPLVCFGAAAVVGLDNPPRVSRRAIAGAATVYLALLAMIHLATPDSTPLTLESVQTAGGFVGAAVALALAYGLGDLGAYIVLIAATFTGVLLLTGSTWSEFLGVVGAAIGTLLQGLWSALVAVASWRPRLRPAAVGAAAGPARAPDRRRSRTAPQEPPAQPRPADKGIFEPEDEEVAEPSAHAEPTDEALTGGEAQQVAAAQPELPLDDEEEDAGDVAAAKPATAATLVAAAPEPEPRWELPDLDLLEPHKDDFITQEDAEELEERVRVLEETLLNFGIPARVRDYEAGPTVTRFEVELEPGTRVSKVLQIQSDLAMAMAVAHVRIEAPIPGKRAVGIEVPNPDRRVVSLRSVIETPAFLEHPSPLAIALGKDVAGRPVVVDLETMPHLLIAGQTGSGKSVCLHTIIVSLLMRATPDEVRFILIDPKRVELTRYDGIPHLYSPVVDTTREAADVLRKVIREMRRRYDRFAVAGVADIDEYNRAVAQGDLPEELIGEARPLPRIVIAVDELGELMTQARAEFEQSICTLARLARATGIHIVLATQRPSVNVVTGQIKANFAARIALRLPAQHDSRTILDVVGADKLLGRGDMLLMTSELSKPVRLQGAWVRRKEIERIVSFLRRQGEPEYRILPELPKDEADMVTEEVDVGDELFEAAVRYVVAEQEASVSMLQRRFKIGYARAGRLIDLMERRGIVGPHEGSRPRRVLVGMHNLDDVLRGIRPTSPEEELTGEAAEDDGGSEHAEAASAK